jgi:flagellar biosynthesis/type III secretory pathway protein FliH
MEQGMEKGVEKGIEIGMEKGVEKGLEKGKSEQTELIYSIINLLKSKQLTKEEIASKVGVTIDFVERWS